MADIVVDVLEAFVWCVEQTLFTFVGIIEGVIVLLSYIPAFIENSLILLELLILGMLSSVKFVLYSLGYAVSFMINLPENLSYWFLFFEAGVGDGLRWTLAAVSFVFTSIVRFLIQTVVLSKQLVLYTLSYAGSLLHFLFFSIVNVSHTAISYLATSSESLLLTLTEKMKQLVLLPLQLFQNFVAGLFNAGRTFLISISNTVWYCWKLPWEGLNKLILGLQNCISFFHPIKGDIKRVVTPHSGVDWLARFSQLMLIFSVIIFILVASVLLYHMRNKIFASLVAVLNLLLTKLSRLSGRGNNNRGNIENQQHPQVVQVQREMERDSDEDIDSSDDDSGFSGTQREENGSIRGGSKEREFSHPGPSTPKKYQMLLQQERDKQLCVVCQDNEKNTLLFPCKHLCVCGECVEQITSSVHLDRRRCPICRGKINSYMDVFT